MISSKNVLSWIIFALADAVECSFVIIWGKIKKNLNMIVSQVRRADGLFYQKCMFVFEKGKCEI